MKTLRKRFRKNARKLERLLEKFVPGIDPALSPVPPDPERALRIIRWMTGVAGAMSPDEKDSFADLLEETKLFVNSQESRRVISAAEEAIGKKPSDTSEDELGRVPADLVDFTVEGIA